jgi:hypothetical protein
MGKYFYSSLSSTRTLHKKEKNDELRGSGLRYDIMGDEMGRILLTAIFFGDNFDNGTRNLHSPTHNVSLHFLGWNERWFGLT